MSTTSSQRPSSSHLRTLPFSLTYPTTTLQDSDDIDQKWKLNSDAFQSNHSRNAASPLAATNSTPIISHGVVWREHTSRTPLSNPDATMHVQESGAANGDATDHFTMTSMSKKHSTTQDFGLPESDKRPIATRTADGRATNMGASRPTSRSSPRSHFTISDTESLPNNKLGDNMPNINGSPESDFFGGLPRPELTSPIVDADKKEDAGVEDSDDEGSIPHGGPQHQDQENARDNDAYLGLGTSSTNERVNVTPGTSINMHTGGVVNLPSVSTLPAEIKDLLEGWYARHGRVKPPCATSSHPHFFQECGKSGKKASWLHKSGVLLTIQLYYLDNIKTKKGAITHKVIVVEGAGLGPYLINFYKNTTNAVEYRIWHGTRGGGDQNGFEMETSVYKVPKGSGVPVPRPAAQSHDPHKAKAQKTPVGGIKPKPGFKGNHLYHADGRPKPRRKSDRQAAPRPLVDPEVDPDFPITRRRTMDVAGPPFKRLRRDDEEPAEYNKLLASFSSSTKDEQRSPLPRSVKPVLKEDELHSHVANNAVFLFYSFHTPVPRARLFSACSSVQRLFAQALAGEVFDESSTAAKVLSVRVAGQQRKVSVVEGDEQDYGDMVNLLEEADCWYEGREGLQGSCTVEVRAKM